MKIQYFSDIHLEFGPCDLDSAEVDVVVAAGDISIGTTGLEWLSKAKYPVIYIAGNHEYYGGDMMHTLNELRVQSRLHNINFLENDIFVTGNVRFLGTTLWTDFDKQNREIMNYASISMNDYNYIGLNGYILTPEDILNIHLKSKEWLLKELEKSFDGKTVVVTHHAPTTESWHGELDSMYLYNYCNAFNKLFKRFDIDLWIHGHIHSTSDYKINNTRIVCNPRGYCDHQTVDGYSISKTVVI